MPLRNTLLAIILTGLAFVGYLKWVVPWVEGQSAEQVPQIDLLGMLRVEEPGQWLALFPQDAWQRDPLRRNMIEADGNIILFREYQNQDDGSLRVAGLTLLLFDQPNPTASPELPTAPHSGDSPVSVAVRDAATPPQKHPLIVEAVEDAILSFDARTAQGLNRYGDLKRVDFLGRVKFWRRGDTPADSFVIDTRLLQITGQQATTAEPVHFQFGASSGQATGLELTFDNPDSLQAQNANVSKIQGFRHLRLGRIDQLSLVTEDQRTLELTCRGPAEFHFRRSMAKFSDDVWVLDRDSGHWSSGNVMVVQFEPPEADASGTPAASPFATRLSPQSLWFYGTPAHVLHPASALQLSAAVLHYNVRQGQFTAGPLPGSGVESWMMEATSRGNQPMWSQVEFQRGQLQLRTPHLRYQQAPTDNPLVKSATPGPAVRHTPPTAGLLGSGTLEAAGPGVLWHAGQTGKPPLEVQWQDRLTVTPDTENPAQWLITVSGDTWAGLDEASWFRADQLYVWLQPSNTPKTGAAAATTPSASPENTQKWRPDLLLARGNVRFQDERLRASVRETRIYFPAGEDSQPPPASPPLDRARDIALVTATEVAAEAAPQRPAAALPPTNDRANAVALNDPTVGSPPTPLPRLTRQATANSPPPRAARGTDITAETMILQLMTAAPASIGTSPPAPTSTISSSPTYRLKTIDLDGGVVIEEAEWNPSTAAAQSSAFPALNNPTPSDSTFEPRYRLLGQRVIGQAPLDSPPGQSPSESAPLGRQQPPDWTATDRGTSRAERATSEALVWTIHGPREQPARLLTPEAELASIELHFDQARQLTWTDQPGVVQFKLPSSDTAATAAPETPSTNLPSAATPNPAASGPPGRGSATWQDHMQFNGRDLALDGHIKLDLQRPAADGQQELLQAHAARLTLELDQPVRLDGLQDNASNAAGQRISAKRLQLYAAAAPHPSSSDPTVRIYRQGKDAAGSLLQQEVVWAQQVELVLDQDRFRMQGPGTLWSLRPASSSSDPPLSPDQTVPQLTYLKVEFQREMNGNWTEGRVDLLGPVAALYGKAGDWQIMDNEARLIDPLRITSNQMTLNRWQPSPNAPVELEWEASGRVHVLGEDFEGNAQQIKYGQQQDLLTLLGDSRAPAKFWQTSTTNGQRNHLAAEKIWYYPDREDFLFEGFQEGNLNFFSGRRGATPAGVPPQ